MLFPPDKTTAHEWKVLSGIMMKPDQQERPGKQSFRYQAFHRMWYPFCNQTDILNPCTQWVVRYPSLYKIRTYQRNSFHLSRYYASQITWLWFPPHRRSHSAFVLVFASFYQKSDAWSSMMQCVSRVLGAQLACMCELACNSNCMCVRRSHFNISLHNENYTLS